MAAPVIGLAIGIVMGILSPFVFPVSYSAYVAIGILACVDSVLGGIKSMMEGKFDIIIFVSGFFTNAILAMFLIWMGNMLSIQLSIAAIVVFGSRLFENFAHIRRFLLNKREKHDNIYTQLK